MKFLRYCLFAIVLLRLLTGTAWAIPTPITMDVPCYEMDYQSDAADCPDCQYSNESHPIHTLCQLCCMGWMVSISELPTPTELPRHTLPIHRAQPVARWQHTPDLRPPIETSMA